MTDYKQQVIKFFGSRIAYDAEGDSHPKEAKRLLEYVSLESGETILDIAIRLYPLGQGHLSSNGGNVLKIASAVKEIGSDTKSAW